MFPLFSYLHFVDVLHIVIVTLISSVLWVSLLMYLGLKVVVFLSSRG